MEPLRYILYARKSSESEDRQLSSKEDQIAVMQDLAKRLGIEIVEIISESKSAKKPGREGFNRMVNMIYSGKANAILTWKLNRLARNPVDAGTISWMLQNNSILHIQTYSGEFKPTDNVLMLQFEFGIANQYIKNLSTDVKRGMRQKAIRGWFPSRLPLGYMHHKKQGILQEKEIIPDPETFHKVSQLWRLILTGNYSVMDMIREAKLIDLKTSNGKPYSRSSFYNMFSNEFYCGYFKWRDANDILVRHKGKHKPIVTLEEFEKVQMILGIRSNNNKPKKLNFAFRGPISCGECGCKFTASQKLQVICTNKDCKRKFSIKTRSDCPDCGLKVTDMKSPSRVNKIYYFCTKNKGACSQRSIEEKELAKQVKQILMEIHISERQASLIRETLEIIKKDECSSKTQQLKEWRKKEQELINRRKNLVMMRADGEISKDQMAELQQNIDNDIRNVQTRIESISESTDGWIKITNEYLTFAEKVVEKFENGGSNSAKAIFSTLGWNLKILDKKLCNTRPFILDALLKSVKCQPNEIEGLEPKKGLENKGSKVDSDPMVPIVSAQLEKVRTFVNENMVFSQRNP